VFTGATFLGTGARLHFTDLGLVVGVLDDDFRCAENSRLRYRVVHGRQPELIGATVALHHLHAANPERRVLRGLTFNACDGKVRRIHPDPAANRELARPLGIDLQDIAVATV